MYIISKLKARLSSFLRRTVRFIASFLSEDGEARDENFSIQSMPIDLLGITLKHAALPRQTFSPNANAVCPYFQKAIDMQRSIEHQNKLATTLSKDNPQKNPILLQEEEIKYLLTNERTILEKTEHSPEVAACFERLKSHKTREASRSFFIFEEILNSLNAAIIEKCIAKSRASPTPRELFCMEYYLTRFPGKILRAPKYKNYWKKLNKLYLGSNQIRSLPPEIAKLTKLKILSLENNQFECLPVEICQLITLEELSISDNQLKCLPPEIGKLIKLKELYLNNNQLEGLPAEIGQLAALCHFFIGHNNLQSLPPQIGQLRRLQRIFLYENQLQSLPPEMRHLVELRELNLDTNQLPSLPLEIEQLRGLVNLNLSRNRLQSLPPQIGQLRELRTLDLDNNRLSNLPPQIRQLTEVKKLDLENNQLQDLPPEIRQCTKLERLFVNNNQLQGLPDNLREDIYYCHTSHSFIQTTKAEVLASQQKPLTDEAKAVKKLKK